MLKPYLKSEADALRCRALGAPNEHIQSEPADPMTPLVARVKKLLATIPLEVAHQGIALEWIRERLAGRQKGRKAQAGEVAAAMRSAGWVRTRQWRKIESGFAARWYPSQK